MVHEIRKCENVNPITSFLLNSILTPVLVCLDQQDHIE